MRSQTTPNFVGILTDLRARKIAERRLAVCLHQRFYDLGAPDDAAIVHAGAAADARRMIDCVLDAYLAAGGGKPSYDP